MNFKEISEIAEIDQLNMSDYFSNVGRKFDVELRKEKIKSEIDEGAIFFFIKENEKVIAYVEYIERANKKVTIKSIQIHPTKRNGFILLKLIKGIYPEFKKSFKDHTVISATHHDNNKSISLHKKLGFIQSGLTDDRILFQCSGSEFLTKTERYI